MQKIRKTFSRLFGGNGYLLLVILGVATVGLSGWLFWRALSAETDGSAAQTPEKIGTQLALPELPAPAAATEPVLPAAVGEPDAQPAPETPAEPVPQKLTVVRPVEGSVQAPFRVEALAYNETMRDWRTHAGLDLAAAEGSPVCAAADGTVTAVERDDFLGRCVTLRHADGYVTHYANLADEVSVAVGDTVTAGQQLGTVGKTALLELASPPHLHFSVTKNNVPVDPEEFLK